MSPPLEARFRAEEGRRSGAVLRSWLLVFVLFNVLSLKLDYDAFGPETFAVPAFLTLAVFTPVAGVAILSLHGRPSPLRRTVATTVTSLVDMLIVLNSARIAPQGHADVYIVLAVIVPLVVGLIAAHSFRHSLVFCGLAFALYLGWILAVPRGDRAAGDLAGGDLAGGGLPLLVSCLILVPIKVSFSRECQEKRAFLLRVSLETQAAELAEANARLTVLSETDALTGVANRRVFDAALAGAWHGTGAAAPDWCAVAAVDIDHFKRLNDSAGHPEGDRCLRAIAAALAGPTRAAGGLLARYGGEEFMVFVPGATPEAALALGEGLRAAVAALAFRHDGDGDPWMASVSVGVTAAHAVTRSHGVGPADLLAAADAALYRAKGLGRNRVEALAVGGPALGDLAARARADERRSTQDRSVA